MKLKILFIFIILFSSTAFASECINWQRLRAEYFPQASKKINEKKVRTIVIQPFTNYTKQEEDDWLAIGMRDLLADMIEAGGRDVLVYSGLSAIYQERAKNPNFVIKGMFQRKNEFLRVFIFVNDGQTANLIKQYSYSVFYPNDADFFRRLGQTAKSIIELTGSKSNDGAIKEIADASTVPASYASYSIAMQIMSSGDLKNLPSSLDFIVQSKKTDPKSLWAYLGAIDLYAFAALRSKLTNRPFGSYLQQMEEEINGLRKIKKTYPINRWALSYEKGEPKSRFLVNHGAFIAGLYAGQEGKFQEAANNLEAAVTAVPEDSISWTHLARIYANLGNSIGSQTALAKANAINSCTPTPVVQVQTQQPSTTPSSPAPKQPAKPDTKSNTEIFEEPKSGTGVRSIKRGWGD